MIIIRNDAEAIRAGSIREIELYGLMCGPVVARRIHTATETPGVQPLVSDLFFLLKAGQKRTRIFRRGQEGRGEPEHRTLLTPNRRYRRS